MVLVVSGSGNATYYSSVPAVANAEDMSNFVSKLWTYARETEHEKIVIGVSIGVSLIPYGQ